MRNDRFSGKNVIFTGGASGIALETCVSFLDEGAKVSLLDIDVEKVKSKIEGMGPNKDNAKAFECDVTNSKSVEEAIQNSNKWMGGIDILITCAGGFHKFNNFESTTEEDWNKIIDLNLKGVFLCCKAVIPYLKERGFGRIINLSSIDGRSVTNGGGPVAYGAAKAAVCILTQHLAKDLAPFNITANSIAPGTTKTERVERIVTPEREQYFLNITPMKRLAKPSEVADVILFFASNESSYITGATIDVNGGRLMVL